MIPPEKFEIQAKAHGLRLVEALNDLLDEHPRDGLNLDRCSADQISELKEQKQLFMMPCLIVLDYRFCSASGKV